MIAATLELSLMTVTLAVVLIAAIIFIVKSL